VRGQQVGSSIRVGRLRLLLALIGIGLAVPALLLLRQAFAQLELESFRQQQLLAEGLTRRIDAELSAAVAIENARGFDDYSFTSGDSRSPLAAYPVGGAVPGALGYFQVDEAGELTTPLLPRADANTGDIGALPARRALQSTLFEILSANALARAEPAADARAPSALAPLEDDDEREQALTLEEAVVREEALPQRAPQSAPLTLASDAQSRFDELSASAARAERTVVTGAESAAAPAESLEESEDRASQTRQAEPPAAAGNERARAEQSSDALYEVAVTASRAKVSTFDRELDPLTFSRLDTGHIVLFRNAWRDGERFVQGLLVEPERLVAQAIFEPFEQSGLDPAVALEVRTGGFVLTRHGAALAGPADAAELIYVGRLSPPLSALEFAFRATELPRGPGWWLVVWATTVMFVVLAGGLVAVYRFGERQIALTEQQRNFVAAVSHELKTPLTSIRMYGEMLRAGWASDEKKQAYYDYIYAEGERLSRLIDNVLTLARLERGRAPLDLELATVGEIVDMLRSKLDGQAKQAGLELEFAIDTETESARLSVDIDALAQVFINLVDNAAKYAAESGGVTISASRETGGSVRFTVRDYGPGIPEPAMRKLFELFYRPDNAMTRTTAGTGIGLALVRELVTAMQGRVDVRNAAPGAEFSIRLPESDG
jgi:two-component system phosphate regulon sensor histidine kinase PhoR